MLKRERTLVISLVQQPEDCLSMSEVESVRIYSRVLSNSLDQRMDPPLSREDNRD
jgi:hypothetical protein